ncbi:MAG: 16S rRNA (cytosine(1402)-N(4))-methyltransferase RsmH [Thermodesulfobacteria bacterium]|nr:16S rRNA (cytosine(1402)-N(4))-methyltransferase RsmH [Thermodesulfobacteriota bacterium]
MISSKNTALGSKLEQIHKPVLVKEVLEGLAPKAGGIYLDATLGLGGHTKALLEEHPEIERVIALDWDEEALELAKERLAPFEDKISFYHSNFKNMELVLSEEGVDAVDGIIMDLGLSSFQLDESGRGFSFMRDEPLDMRMDRATTVMASDMVNKLPEERLAELIQLYGEESWAKKIAAAIVARRKERPIFSTLELATIVKEAIPRRFHPRKIHPATKTFQAIRIAINREFENLTQALGVATKILRPGGRLCVISFHSLEDRIVKRFFKSSDQLRILTKKPLRPTEAEVVNNPRSRSAKLRVAEKKAQEMEVTK